MQYHHCVQQENYSLSPWLAHSVKEAISSLLLCFGVPRIRHLLNTNKQEVFSECLQTFFEVRVPFFSGVLGAFLGFYLLLVLGNLVLQLGLCRYFL